MQFFLNKYTQDKWLKTEQEWLDGKIGTEECLSRQLALVDFISKKELDELLLSLRIDEYFLEFYSFIKEKQIPFIIVSDGLDYFIEKVLQNNGISGIEFWANHLELINNKLNVEFRNKNELCKINAGMCKCNIMNIRAAQNKKTIYIGDGKSDCCAVKKADFVFAKDYLLDFCEKSGMKNYCEFKNFNDILKCLNS